MWYWDLIFTRNLRENDGIVRKWIWLKTIFLSMAHDGHTNNDENSLSNTCDSFIPSAIRQWNSLDPSLRNKDSIAKFKTELRKRKDISQVPKHDEIELENLILY